MATNKGTASKDGGMNVKYTALPIQDSCTEDEHKVEVSEEMSLIDNMETVHISDDHADFTDQNSNEEQTTENGNNNREPTNEQTQETNANIQDNDEDANILTDVDDKSSKPEVESDHFDTESGGRAAGVDTVADNNLDIVRKMSQPMSANYIPWQKIGSYSVLKTKACQRIYAKSGRADDLALFFMNGRFHVMEAWCSHMGGPLFEGDIEDYNGRCHVMCPWHSYMFDLETGKNEIGLEQKVYELKLENAHVYVRYKSELSLVPTRKASEVQGPLTIHPPNGKAGKPVRKDSVLENVMRLA